MSTFNISGGKFDGNSFGDESKVKNQWGVMSDERRHAVQSEMKQLREAVNSLKEKAPPAVVESATKHLDNLEQAVSQPTPDRRWYDVSAAGLLEAANAVAALGTPIVNSVKTLSQLLGGQA